MNSKELLMQILLHKINRVEDRLKAESKRVSLVNRKIKIRIKDHNLDRVKNRIIILSVILNKL